jgi:hypothetical protein
VRSGALRGWRGNVLHPKQRIVLCPELETALSKRGVDFLNDWVVEHINPDAYPTENDPRARQYVQECLADAAKSGISRKEIEEDVGNIQGRIIKAMELATDREIEHKP